MVFIGLFFFLFCVVFFFQAKDGIRDLVRSRGLGDVYKRQPGVGVVASPAVHGRTLVWRVRPLGAPGDEAAVLETVEDGVKGGDAEREMAARAEFDQAADLVPMPRAVGEDTEDEQFEAALLQFGGRLAGRIVSHDIIIRHAISYCATQMFRDVKYPCAKPVLARWAGCNSLASPSGNVAMEGRT